MTVTIPNNGPWQVYPVWDKYDYLFFHSAEGREKFRAQVKANGFDHIDDWANWQCSLADDDPDRMFSGEDYEYFTKLD